MAIERLSALGSLAWGGRRLADRLDLIVAFGVVGVLNLLAELSAGVSSVALTVAGIVGMLAAGALAHVAAYDSLADPERTVDDPTDRVISKLPALFAVAVVLFVAVVAGTLALILPGIYLAARLSLALPACVIADVGVSRSIRESWDVAHGNLLKLLGVNLVSLLVSVAVPVALAVATGSTALLSNPATVSAVLIPVSALVTPIVQLALGRIYVENAEGLSLRVEDDGADDDDVGEEPRTPAQW